MFMRLAAALLAVLVAFPAFAQQQQRPQQQQPAPQFTLKNEGEVQLQELYVARGGQGARNWGPDRFGSDVVPAGGTFRVRLPSGFGCLVDIRIVFEDGEEEVRERVDVCRNREVSFARALPAAGSDRAVVIENRSPRSINQLFVSGTRETEWGEDRLGSETVQPGGSFTAQVPDHGCAYDVRVVFDNGGAEERRNLDLCETATLVIVPGWTTADTLPRGGAGQGPAAAAGQVSVVNRSGRTVFEMFSFPDGAASRGPDRLGTDTMADGATVRIPAAAPPDCASTLAITYDDGTREQREGIDLCATTEIVIAPGWTGADPAQGQAQGQAQGGGQQGGPAASSPGTVGIVNRSGRVVFELYSYPDGAAEEGPDRLGADVMREGGSVRVPAARAPNCATTVRITYDNGDREERTGLDFCALSEVVIEAGWTEARPPHFASIVNGGPAPIIALHADAPGTPRGPDRLGDQVIGVGQAFVLAPPDAGSCTYDITAVFRDRRTARIAGADLCSGVEIRIAP
ncbi:hypothetical protein [Elioraea rosea]|uniref:hypothetical protein n=1 Tax=Elioraea rosea TaxID=2492390 RepID=UPI00118256B5|nr:hypothetical protein [Elioraea rosea]